MDEEELKKTIVITEDGKYAIIDGILCKAIVDADCSRCLLCRNEMCYELEDWEKQCRAHFNPSNKYIGWIPIDELKEGEDKLIDEEE